MWRLGIRSATFTTPDCRINFISASSDIEPERQARLRNELLYQPFGLGIEVKIIWIVIFSAGSTSRNPEREMTFPNVSG